jgi:Ca2+-binding RTX toxin-like protein
MATVNNQNIYSGTLDSDLITGTTGADTLSGAGGNDTLAGGLGNDLIDGGSGYNTYRVVGSADAFFWSVNSLGQVILTDAVTDAFDPLDGSNEGTDTLTNIQVIEYWRPDGTLESSFQIDDFSNSVDSGNTQIQYGVLVNGRANFYGDLDYFKLDTVAGQSVVLSGGGSSSYGYLAELGEAYSIQGQNGYFGGNSQRTLTWNASETMDVYFTSNELSSTSPMASKGYSFILRRTLDGTDGADTLIAGDNFEHITGGLGDDTLTGSERSDYLSGGAGNDIFIGGGGNDEIDGGEGTANIAVFSGNKSEYTVNWTGDNLSLTLADKVSERDGIDKLTNIQTLRFANGDVVLDAESNFATPIGAVNVGQIMSGTLPITNDYRTVDVDYFQQKLTADISTSTALRLTLTVSADQPFYGNAEITFFYQGTNERLSFTDLSNSSTIDGFNNININQGSSQSWIVSPLNWGSSTDFLATAQRADVRVSGYTYSPAEIGDVLNYTIKLDRVLYGTNGSDTLTGDGLAGYIDARDGNDVVSGGAIDEEIVGGAGNDTLSGNGGNDTLVDALGQNVLNGGEGDDVIDVSASAAPTATVDGGSGNDTLKIGNNTSWTGLNVSNVETLDGSGANTRLSFADVAAKGFTTANNIIFELNPGLSSGATLDGSALSGNFGLRGTNQSDTLIGNAGANNIYLNSSESAGSGRGADTVEAGAGDDRIILQTQSWRAWSDFFTDVALAEQTYYLRGNLNGGAGADTLELNFNDIQYVNHAWGGYFKESSWKLDLAGVVLNNIESLVMMGNQQGQEYPTEIILSAEQIEGLTQTSGLPAVTIVGGGNIDLAHLSALGIKTWRLGDESTYSLTGTELADTVTVGAGTITLSLGGGADEIVIDSKSLVNDVLDGGLGSDTLTIRGTDVDLSGATLLNIESIKVSAQSLSMTEAQWETLGSIVTRISGANTGYILSVITAGTSTLIADSPFVGLTGSSGDDVLVGNASDNILVGGAGADLLTGHAGNDRLVTGAGLDTLAGGLGDDTLVVTDKINVRDQLDGGLGTDTLQVSDGQNLTAANISNIEVLKGTGTVTLNASQLAGFSQIQGLSVQLAGDSNYFSLGTTKIGSGANVLLPGVDPVVALSSGAIIGSKGDDTIAGGNNGDLLIGGRGSDLLSGGVGNDTLVGGSGLDTLAGDSGDDLFLVEASEFSNASAEQVMVKGASGNTGYFDGRNHVIYADAMDGGSGLDTLVVELASYSAYVVNAGLITNIENLDIKLGNYDSFVALDASVLKQFSTITATSQNISDRNTYATLGILGNKEDLNFDNIASDAYISRVDLRGTFYDIDTSRFTFGPSVWESFYSVNGLYYNHIKVSDFNSIKLSSGNDGLIVDNDLSFSIDAGGGDDWIQLKSIYGALIATIEGGAGDDRLDISSNSFIDLSQSTITSVETIQYGSSTLVVTEAQLDSLSFDGSGAKYTKVGNAIVGTMGDDSYTGSGIGSFKGDKGNDAIANVNTAVFNGNYSEYDFTRSGNTLTVQHARASLSDGTDTITGVMNLKFADVTIKIDDAPDSYYQFIDNSSAWSSLTHAEYSKRISAKKDFASDTDIFSATLVPNSPIAIEGSSLNGDDWRMQFFDAASGQTIQFKSLVLGWVLWDWSSWMEASQKWLPGFNTENGFKPYEGGEVVIQMSVQGAIQDYAFTLNYLDDYAGSIDTLGQMDAQTGEVKGYIGDLNDADWIRTDLIAGTKYEFNLKGLSSGAGTLVDPKLQLLDGAGRLIEAGIDVSSDSVGNDDVIIYRPTESGSYYLAVTDVAKINQGSWTLTQQSLDTIAGNTSTTERIDWSGANTFTINSEINVLTDHDWFKVWLDKGITYNFSALGASNGGTLADPQVSVRSVTGILLAQDDNSGGGTDAKLAYSAPDSGWYFLDVGASGNASKGTYIIQGSTLADDFSNDRLTTGVVQAGTPLQGLISYLGDQDWVKVGLSKGVTYVINMIGDSSDNAQLDPLLDPLLTIRDANGDVISRFDDFGGTLDARAYFTPTTDGLYYLEAKSAFKYDIGAYELSVTQAPPDDFDSAMTSSAASLTLGTAMSGEIGIPGDRDVFKVNLESSKVYQVSVEGLAGHAGTLADSYLRIFDSAGRLVDFDNNGGAGNDARMYFAPTLTGTYYVEASSNHDRGMGSYSVNVVQRDMPADDVPNNLSTQVFLNAGDSFDGNLLTHLDQDWFGIKLVAGKDYVFRAQASHSGNGSLNDPVLEIRSAEGSLLKTVDNMLMGNEPAMLYTPQFNGTYYLVVKAADGQTDTGTYKLITRAPDDYSNTKSAAQTIILDQTLEGSIQWSDGAFGVRSYDSVGLATDIDEDWFKFEAIANQVLSVKVEISTGSALSRPLVEIVDELGHSVAVGDGLETTNGQAIATFKAATAGFYYARLIDGAGGTGAYKISLFTGDASDEDASVPLEMSFSTQGSVVLAETNARIGLAGDTDNFVVDLQQGHQYRIETLAVRDGSFAPLGSAQLGLNWLAQGSTIPETIDVLRDVASPSFFDRAVFSATTSGTLAINVSPLDLTQTGQYKLRVVDLGVSQGDDRPDSIESYGSTSILAINENIEGRIDSLEDKDLYAVNLTAGNLYDFSIKSYLDGLGTLSQAELHLLDAEGQFVTAGSYDEASGRTLLPVSVFEDGRYYLSVSATDMIGNVGTYMLDTRLRGVDESTDDIRADTQSGVTAGPGTPVSGVIDYGTDHDWIKVAFSAGKSYVLDVLADGNGAGGTLKDASLRLLDAKGNTLAFDDNSGAGLDAHLQITSLMTGDYFLDVGSSNGEVGTYTVRVRELYSGEADPLKSAQWYLTASGLHKLNGEITGAGVKIGVVDDGIDTSHPDLQNQLDFALAYDTQFDSKDGQPKYPMLIGPPDNHGTLVAGIIAAEANNETGIVGVAPDSELVSTRVKWTWDQITEALGLQWQFDVSNNSWGAISPFSDNFNSTNLTFAWQGLRKGVEMGRDGLGTVFVFSAGNSAGTGDNTNYHNFQNAREVMAVGAAQADGSMASFSTPGANVLVSSYGVNMITTDRHQPGWGVDGSSNYIVNFSGTSASAPMVSGIVALMLEVNPTLGYRDVQEILVYASTHPEIQDWKTNGASNFNLGGLRFNDKAGFGIVDAYAAVKLAETWNDVSTSINEVSASARKFGLTDAIPDDGSTVYTRTFTIDSAINIEHVELGVDLRHTRIGDLVIELTSPNGTVSTLMDRPTVNAEQPFGLSGADSGVPTHLLWDFSSVQFWGEEASGTWTVTVKDVRAEETGMIHSLSLRVYGERDDGNDTYVFTDEGFTGSPNRILSDESGIDTINASPVQSDMYIDLGLGFIASQGVTYTISQWTTIENAISGSGDDRLDGNDSSNLLNGMDGNDLLYGGLGNDTLIGGLGADTARFDGKLTEFGVSWNPTTRLITVVDNKISDGNEGTDQLSGIERIVFSDGELSLGALVGNKAPVATKTFFDAPIYVASGMGINFDLPEAAFSDVDSSFEELSVEVSSASGGELPDWLSYDSTTKTFTGVPPADLQGQIQLLVTAIDEFGSSASDILTLQFGDNQAPILALPSELVLNEDAELTNLGLLPPQDPEGKDVSITILDIPSFGVVLDKAGVAVVVGTKLSADGLSELHYQTAKDLYGNAGYLRYQATDEDGVTAESSVVIYIDAVNDAPRFATSSSKLPVNYPEQSSVPLDMAKPTDPESVIDRVTVIDLPSIGSVSLDGDLVSLNQVLTFDQLDRLIYTLSENVNGPVGAVTIQAVDPQGLATNWSLAIEIQGSAVSNMGTSGADSLYGSIADDILYGMAGNDILVGNAGNDRLLGGLGQDSLFGGAGDDQLDGSSGNDYIDGGFGNDVMAGGPGNDTYVVDVSGDIVLEVISGGAGGKDLILTSVSLVAPTNIEMLQASSGVLVDLTGNTLDNTLVGNELANALAGGAGRDTLIGAAGDDSLDGGESVDRMAGGVGNDTYFVDSRYDSIVELSGEGTDTVYATTSFTLSSNIENLFLQGIGDFTAGGNSLNNHLKGNVGNNILAGGLGEDTLEGGLGNDVYVLSDALDVIIDTGGIDTIRSPFDIELMASIENGELVGIADASVIGNVADNILKGNMGNNLLDGGLGVDTLTGGAGSDQFIISFNGLDHAPDTITDLSAKEDLLIIDLASFGVQPSEFGLTSSGLAGQSTFIKGAGASSLDPNDYFILDTARGILKFDVDGSGASEAIDLVIFSNTIDPFFSAENIYVAV